jgi:hypothetical protein
MKRRQFGGAGANTLTYMRSVQNQKCCRAWNVKQERETQEKDCRAIKSKINKRNSIYPVRLHKSLVAKLRCKSDVQG